jgi:cell division protein ZapA
MKQLEVKIMGQSYLLGCPDGGDARLLEAVDKVDIAMCKIRDAGKIKARDRIAVLAALNLAFELSDRPAVTAPVRHPDGAANDAPDESPDDAQMNLQVGALLSRLDTALAVDGRLL